MANEPMARATIAPPIQALDDLRGGVEVGEAVKVSVLEGRVEEVMGG
jgi:hypothetical protein